MDEHQSNGQEIIVQPTENIVEIDGGNMFTTSLIVAQAFEKNHFDVLKAIKNLECYPNLTNAILLPLNTWTPKAKCGPPIA